MAFNLGWKFDLEVVCSLYYLNPESIVETTIYQYQLFHCNNSTQFSLSQAVFFMHT